MKKLLALALILLVSSAAFAEDKITRVLDKSDTLTMVPDTEMGKYAYSIAGAYPVRIESSATYKRNGKSMLDIANRLTGISTINGTEYYSQRKKETAILFDDAYTVDNPKTLNRTDDVKFTGELPSGIDIYGLLDDSRFGENVYLFSYRFTKNGISLMITNFDDLRYSFVKAVEPNNFMFLLDVAITDDEIKVYNAGFCKPTILPSFMEERIRGALTNRINALFDWFEKEVTK